MLIRPALLQDAIRLFAACGRGFRVHPALSIKAQVLYRVSHRGTHVPHPLVLRRGSISWFGEGKCVDWVAIRSNRKLHREFLP